MQSELQALLKNNTWSYETLPPNKKAIRCRWVYKKKYRSDESIEKYKAKLVAQGFAQQEGLDFFLIYFLHWQKWSLLKCYLLFLQLSNGIHCK